MTHIEPHGAHGYVAVETPDDGEPGPRITVVLPDPDELLRQMRAADDRRGDARQGRLV